MAITSFQPRAEYIGTGSLKDYTFDFKIKSLEHLIVGVFNTTTMAETFRVRGSDTTYLTSVTFDAESGGGTVHLTSNLPSGHRLFILLANDAPLQESQFRNKNDFTLKRFEDALDVIAGAVQRLTYLGKRSLRITDDLPDTQSFNAEIPIHSTNILVENNVDRILAVGDDNRSLKLGPKTTDLAAQAAAAASSATASAASASAAATSATNSATSATNSANSATASATSATNSANSATASAGSATNAATSATNAANSASAAATSAAQAIAAGGLQTDLANLANTAINKSLVPGTDQTLSLGSLTKNWVAAYVSQIFASAMLLLQTVDKAGSITDDTVVATGDVTSGSYKSGDVYIYSGNSTGPTGTIYISAGNGASAPVRGSVNIEGNNINLVGTINSQGNEIIGLPTPTVTGSAARKKYVDDQDAATLAAANSSASSGDATTLSSANSYADGKVGSVAVVGSTPNTAGASIASGVLTLQPADSTRPGLVTALAQTFGGVKSFIDSIRRSAVSGITAFAGGGQASATALTKDLNRVTTVATAADSTKLPTASAGMEIVVINKGAASMNVFPATGESINSLAANVAYAVAAGANVRFLCAVNGTWDVATAALANTVQISDGGTGATTQTAAFNALSPNTTKGDVTVHNGTSNVRIPVGADGTVYMADSAQATGTKWGTVLTNPMTTAGDMIVGGTSGTPTRLAAGTNGYIQKMVSGSPAWAAPVSQLSGVSSYVTIANNTWANLGTSVTLTAGLWTVTADYSWTNSGSTPGYTDYNAGLFAAAGTATSTNPTAITSSTTGVSFLSSAGLAGSAGTQLCEVELRSQTATVKYRTVSSALIRVTANLTIYPSMWAMGSAMTNARVAAAVVAVKIMD